MKIKKTERNNNGTFKSGKKHHDAKGEKNSNWKGGKPHCIDCGVEIGYENTRCKSCSVKIQSHYINKHHKNLNKENNEPSNLLYLIFRDHCKLHRFAYNYLVKIGKINEYIKWFIEKYDIKCYTKEQYDKLNRLIEKGITNAK